MPSPVPLQTSWRSGSWPALDNPPIRCDLRRKVRLPSSDGERPAFQQLPFQLLERLWRTAQQLVQCLVWERFLSSLVISRDVSIKLSTSSIIWKCSAFFCPVHCRIHC